MVKGSFFHSFKECDGSSCVAHPFSACSFLLSHRGQDSAPGPLLLLPTCQRLQTAGPWARSRLQTGSVEKSMGSGARMPGYGFDLTLSRCGSLDELNSLAVPLFPHLQNRNIFLSVVVRIRSLELPIVSTLQFCLFFFFN